MAKTQNLSLNPTKISGACGRLMCCLKYEQAAYEDAAKRMPKAESFVDTPDGVGNVSGVDLLREQVQVRLDSAPESPKRYKNAEVRVLRSGKGSREGIEIPKERPPRQAPLEAESHFRRAIREPVTVPSLLAGQQPDEAHGEDRSGSRRRNNTARRSGKPRQGDGKRTEKRQEPRPKVERVDRLERVEKLPIRTVSDVTAEKKAAADRAARQQGESRAPDTKGTVNRRRPYRKPRQRS